MDIGISSSCFYPCLTEDAFRKVGELGAVSAEIFFNASCEMKGPVLKEILKIQNYYNIDVRSVHPFTSYTEPFALLGGYERRAVEAADFYKRYFEAACALGADAVVIHGGNAAPKNEESYFESFLRLCQIADEYGVIPAHENVNEKAGCDIAFLKRLKNIVGDKFKLVLDIKQCRRMGVSEYDFIKNFADDLIQIHISDYDDYRDCIPPGKGKYDFLTLFKTLKANGYNKSAVIELYDCAMEDSKQIADAKIYLENLG